MLTTEELEERKRNRHIRAALNLLEELSGNFNPDTDNAAYIAGGVAVIFWVQDFRVTQDLDAIFDGELLDGKAITKRNNDLFIDFNFNDTLSLVQEDYRERAVPVGKFGSLTVFVVAPVDLVLMKISRGTEKDMNDVRMLIESGIVDREELARLAEDAFAIYIGNPAYPKSNLAKAMEFFNDEEATPAYRPRP